MVVVVGEMVAKGKIEEYEDGRGEREDVIGVFFGGGGGDVLRDELMCWEGGEWWWRRGECECE